MFTVNEIKTHIKKYIIFLQNEFNLGISLHPHSYDAFLSSPELANFYIHNNPYCQFLKKNIPFWEHCLDCQAKVYNKCINGPYSGICHAGVKEYVYPINKKDTVVGFLSISGYKAPLELRGSYLKKISRIYHFEYNPLSEIYEVSLCDEFPEKERIDSLIMPLLLMFELAYTKLLNVSDNDSHDQAFYLRVLHFINLNYNNRLTLDLIAKHFNFSKSYISHNFKLNTGYTINQYINFLRIKQAKDMLANTNINITELSTALGFSSSNYFTIVFKEFENMSPSEYRNKYQSSK